MAGRLSYSITVNLLTENFKKGVSTIKSSFRSIQMQVVTFAAALGAGSLGITGFLSSLKDTARQTNRVLIALKNISGSTQQFSANLAFLNGVADKYGIGINGLIDNFAKFSASATQANMPMQDQQHIFESVSRACAAFNLSADRSDEVMVALYQMMGKGKISSEELRKQMGEKLPVAMQAMAQAAGTSMAGLEQLLKQGKLMSADILPKFADALNKLIPNVDTDNLETSLSRLGNMFVKFTQHLGVTGKYKAIVDELTKVVQSASENIQNIIIGVIAVIAFAVSQGLTKIYRGYAATGQQIITNATVTQGKLEAATAARVDAELSLEKAKAEQLVALQAQQLQAARNVAKAELLLQSRIKTESIAQSKAVLAAEEASAIQSQGAWAIAGASIVGTFKKLVLSIKSLLSTFAPALLISALAALTTCFINAYRASQKLQRLTKNYYTDLEKERIHINLLFNALRKAKQGTEQYNKAKSQIISRYGQYLQGLSQEITSLKNVEGAYKAISNAAIQAAKDRAIEKGTNDATSDYLKVYKRNAGVLSQSLKSSFGQEKGTELFDEILEKIGNDQEIGKQAQAAINSLSKSYVTSNGTVGTASITTVNDAASAIDEIKRAKKQLNEQIQTISSIFGKKSLSTDTAQASKPQKPIDAAAEEKRLAALRGLDEADKQRQLDKQQFDLSMRQKDIDLLDDSFYKRLQQEKLNYDKEKVVIEQASQAIAKKQLQYAKNLYIKDHGTAKGFENYYALLKKNNFKDAKQKEVMPEGLRPADITKQVQELSAAALKAYQQGNAKIAHAQALDLEDQENTFSDSLQKKLMAIDRFYDEQAKRYKYAPNQLKLNENNRQGDKLKAISSNQLNNLDLSQEITQERLFGMQSIGMDEFVEQKRYEIAIKYIKKRIEALKPLAELGNADAQNQIKLLTANLQNLNFEKPAKGLKELADEKLFNIIVKGFERMGNSPKQAEAKTIKFFSNLKTHATQVAETIGELQSAFGGLNEDLDKALQAASNIANGFASGGLRGGLIAIAGEATKLIVSGLQAEERHAEALKKIKEEQLASQRAYNLALMEQNMLMDKFKSIFGEDSLSEATTYAKNYVDAIKQVKSQMKDGLVTDDDKFSRALFGKSLSDLYGFKKELAGLADAEVVTGHQKTGLFGWGKGRDVYTSILKAYDDVIDKDGKLNIQRIQSILATRKMSDETKAYLENLVNLDQKAQDALKGLHDYLHNTFGSIGDGLSDAIVNALKEGTSAWDDFQKAGNKVVENLGKQLLYQLLQDDLKPFEDQIEKIYQSNDNADDQEKAAQDKVNQVEAAMAEFFAKEKSKIPGYEDFLKKFQEEASKEGFDPFEKDGNSQSSSKGGYDTMTQDQAGDLVGRFTGLGETGLRIEAILSTISLSVSTMLRTQPISLLGEMKKHTELLSDIKQLQQRDSFRLEESEKLWTAMDSKLGDIKKNTKSLG